MANLDALRKIIREEVKAVFQEELAGILKEAILNKGTQTITETTKVKSKPSVPNTLNTLASRPAVVAPTLSPGNPLASLLQETARTMSTDDFGNISGAGVVKDVPVVDSVADMFASAKGRSSVEAVEINAVPDFTAMMSKMGL